jgi:hypothetical protein
VSNEIEVDDDVRRKRARLIQKLAFRYFLNVFGYGLVLLVSFFWTLYIVCF